MIKKMTPILFAIMIFVNTATIVMADSFQINTDKSTVSPGETVTVSIALDETMVGEFRNLQGQLSYETALLTYVSHQTGASSFNYTFANLADRNYFTFSNTDFTDDGFSQIGKGAIASVKFKVKDEITEEHLKTALRLTINIQDIKGKSEELTSSDSILICTQNHDKSNDSKVNNEKKVNDELICKKCGGEYVIDEALSTQSIDEDIDNDETKESDHQNNSLLIAAIITALIAACVLISYRRKYRE